MFSSQFFKVAFIESRPLPFQPVGLVGLEILGSFVLFFKKRFELGEFIFQLLLREHTIGNKNIGINFCGQLVLSDGVWLAKRGQGQWLSRSPS